MMDKDIALKLDNVSKQYRLGLTGTGTISHDLNRWWHKIRGKEDPYSKVGVENDRSVIGGDYVWALKDINLEVKQGEILGIIGKNGAGKSTLLKLLSKITGPTTGEIIMNGRMASLLEVGTGFHPELTGRENIFLNGAILGMSKREIRSKLDDIVDFSGCAKYVDTPVKRYSSGMRVRLGFAVAAFLEPDILVVDEVLAVGDAEFQKQAIGKMKDVSANGGRTVLFVSHNMTSIRSLCNRGVLMDKGKVAYDGSVEEAISKYLFQNRSIQTDNLQTNVKDVHRKFNTGEAKFTSVEIRNEKEIVTDSFNFRERLKLKLRLQVLKKVENVNIQLGIVNRFSEVVCYGVSKDEYYKGVKFDEGEYEIEYVLPNDLMPGEYGLRIGLLHNFTGSAIDLIEYFYPFKVSTETSNADFVFPWATVHGYVEMKNNWNITKIE